jgi:hypothetical protein
MGRPQSLMMETISFVRKEVWSSSAVLLKITVGSTQAHLGLWKPSLLSVVLVLLMQIVQILFAKTEPVSEFSTISMAKILDACHLEFVGLVTMLTQMESVVVQL